MIQTSAVFHPFVAVHQYLIVRFPMTKVVPSLEHSSIHHVAISAQERIPYKQTNIYVCIHFFILTEMKCMSYMCNYFIPNETDIPYTGLMMVLSFSS